MITFTSKIGKDSIQKNRIVCSERESKRNILSLVMSPIVDHLMFMSDDAIKAWLFTAIEMVYGEDAENAKNKREAKGITTPTKTEADFYIKTKTLDKLSGPRLLKFVYDVILAGEGMPLLQGFSYESFLQFDPEKTSIRDISKLGQGLSQSVGRWKLGK